MVIEKYPRAGFNRTHWYIRDNIFNIENGQQILLDFFIKLAVIFSASHGFIAHRIQERKQSPPFTLERRLPGVFWVNFFGSPYIEFFGRNKFLNSSLFAAKEIEHDLFMIKREEDLVSSMRPEFERKVDSVKNFIGREAFASENFPDEPCLVPVFDFSELRNVNTLEETESETIYQKMEKSGYSLVSDDQDEIVFQNEKGSVVEFNKKDKLIRFFETSEIRNSLQTRNLPLTKNH